MNLIHYSSVFANAKITRIEN